MTYSADQKDALERLFPGSTAFCHYHAEYSDHLVENTINGVLFLMAWWSAPAIDRFKLLCDVFGQRLAAAHLRFYVVDVDGLISRTPFARGERIGGYGEIFWIKDGRVVGSMGADWSAERFEKNMALLAR
ncbi:MAG: hypothetical protein V4773_11825 [Verrucomicrobiota bacterium]